MKEINVLGIQLKDYALRESLKLVDGYMKNRALNTIAYISSQILVTADGNAAQKEWIESMDMTVCAETDILNTDGGLSKNRVKEVEEDAFLTEFLKKTAREKRKLFLLAETQEGLQLLQDELIGLQGNLQIVGKEVVAPEMNIDNLINEINDLVPDIILSRLPSPRQECLMYENKKKINAAVWLALLEGNVARTRRQNAWKRVMRYIYKKVFRKKVADYRNKEE